MPPDEERLHDSMPATSGGPEDPRRLNDCYVDRARRADWRPTGRHRIGTNCVFCDKTCMARRQNRGLVRRIRVEKHMWVQGKSDGQERTLCERSGCVGANSPGRALRPLRSSTSTILLLLGPSNNFIYSSSRIGIPISQTFQSGISSHLPCKKRPSLSQAYLRLRSSRRAQLAFAPFSRFEKPAILQCTKVRDRFSHTSLSTDRFNDDGCSHTK